MFDFINNLASIFQYEFAQKAFLAGLFVAVSASVLGVFLVLRKQALITDGLAHISFASVALALLLGWAPVFASLPLVILASFLINRLNERANMGADAAIGLVSSFSVACGIIIISLTGGINVDIGSYLFGSILAVQTSEVVLAAVVMVFVVATVFIFYNDFFVFVFDPEFAAVCGIRKKRIDLYFAILQSVVIIVGIRIIGALLMSSLVIFPAVTALQFVKRFKSLILFSVIFAVITVLSGIILSFFTKVPTGAGIVVFNALLFGGAFLFSRIRKINR